MATATVQPGIGDCLTLKPEDRETWEEGGEFESPRSALDRTLERLASAETAALQRDLGYSCEWWLPT